MIITDLLNTKQVEKAVPVHEKDEKTNWCPGERNFVAAILGRAICDLFHTRKRHRRIKTSAKRWIASDVVGFPSFVWCCHHLDLNPKDVRDAIRNLNRPNYIRGDVMEKLR